MTKRMLIDSTHAEETRVVVLDGNRLEDFDVETSTKQQLKGNIYLAKIVRVEPSLQAAFVEFGGGRHGFLTFSEIHPDYYQIPVADRKRLVEMQEAEAREEEEEEERQAARVEHAPPQDLLSTEDGHAGNEPAGDEPAAADAMAEAGYAASADPELAIPDTAGTDIAAPVESEPAPLPDPSQVAQPAAIAQDILVAADEAQALFGDPVIPDPVPEAATTMTAEDPGPSVMETADAGPGADALAGPAQIETVPPAPPPETVGGAPDTETDERPEQRPTPRFMRHYKIQEVIRRRQILLVQVVKEERGNKGAALTTYISLAGRFSVLMPNSPRGGGISRKITSAADRRRLKEVTSELDLPRGMGLIIRTAGANRPKPEILRDCEYLLDQWDQIRDLTMKSMAPALIYEEASLIKRTIRDVYSRDVDDILVDGETGWRAARDFMRMLMPTHAKKVQLWKDPQPLFAKAQVEAQLDAMLQPVVQLRSGGYLVINQTEALVAIDVNSGRSTRERGIEETAFRTNLEAAEECARQLRLRDLAGLIVIDFIDMESRRNNAAVERKLKDALKNDRARIQVGAISSFGLLEMSRQRLRPSLTETSFVTCPHCGGSGHVRSTESAALAVLRGIEDEGARRRSAEIVVHVAGTVAFYILNHKRLRLSEIEQRFGLVVTFNPDESLRAPEMRIERVRAQAASDAPAPISQLPPPEAFDDPDEETTPDDEELPEAVLAEAVLAGADDEPAAETADDADQRQKRRRRRRGGKRRDEAGDQTTLDPMPPLQPLDAEAAEQTGLLEAPAAEDGEADAAAATEDSERKRRGRRGGRRRRRADMPLATEGEAGTAQADEPGPPPPVQQAVYQAPTYQVQPVYQGPTPANPFGGSNAFDFFDAVEQDDPRPARTPTNEPVPASPLSMTEEPEVGSPPADGTTMDASPLPTLDVAELPLQTDESAMPEPPAAPPESGPAISPVIIGASDAEPAEKKRGWWRR